MDVYYALVCIKTSVTKSYILKESTINCIDYSIMN